MKMKLNFKYRKRNVAGWRKVDVYIDDKKLEKPFWMREGGRVGQEIWEYRGRMISLVDLTSAYKNEIVPMSVLNLLKMQYKNNRWEWVELPMPINDENWGTPRRYRTKAAARKAAITYLLLEGNEDL